MKLVYKPCETIEEARKCREFLKAMRDHQKEFFSNPLNTMQPYRPLLITHRILVSEEKAKEIRKKKK